MTIKKAGFTPDELELFHMVDSDDHLYDQAHFEVADKLILSDIDNNYGVLKVFTYRASLRIAMILEKTPCSETVFQLTDLIKKSISSNSAGKNTILMWYSQKNGFSNAVIDQFSIGNPYHFCKYQIKNADIVYNDELSGLEKYRCIDKLIDPCIEVMEEVFTPSPDAPGSFRKDRERIKDELLNNDGGTDVFFKEDELVGFCGHRKGHVIDVCIRKKFQGRGYGKIIVCSTLKSIYQLGYDAELITGCHNKKAISLYATIGFKRLLNSVRVNIYC